MVEVRMFGPLGLRVDGSQLGTRDFGGVKPKQLLEVLLLERGRLVPKDRIAELLWGAALPRRVAATVETYVAVLRRRLDARPGLGRRLIATEPGGYRLIAEQLVVDVDHYEWLLRRAAAAAEAERRSVLEAAVEIGELELLADEPYGSWVVPAREHYRERQVQALVDLAECCLDQGDQRAALAAAERAIARERTRERAYRAVMRAHQAVGDRDGALRAYERCRQALVDELGVGPGSETAALHGAIVRDEAPERRPVVPIAYARHGPGPDRLPGRGRRAAGPGVLALEPLQSGGELGRADLRVVFARPRRDGATDSV
jgi:DNA-binding SARP family transcriptional activator